jgi:hypothetical protein
VRSSLDGPESVPPRMSMTPTYSRKGGRSVSSSVASRRFVQAATVVCLFVICVVMIPLWVVGLSAFWIYADAWTLLGLGAASCVLTGLRRTRSLGFGCMVGLLTGFVVAYAWAGSLIAGAN